MILWCPFTFHFNKSVIRIQPFKPFSVPWLPPRNGLIGNPLVMLPLVGQGIWEGNPILWGLFLYSLSGSGDTTNKKNFKTMYFQHVAHFLSTWVDPNRATRSQEEQLIHWWGAKRTMQKMKLTPTWKVSWAMYVSLSHSNSPLVVYWKMEEVMLSIRLDTRCFRSSSGSAFRTAFWKTTLNAWGCTDIDTTISKTLKVQVLLNM